MTAVDTFLAQRISAATPSQDERTRASRHRSKIEERLRSSLSAFRIFETGSWSHGTAASPWSDIDYFVSLRGARPRESAEDLGAVRGALFWLPGASVRVDRPSVKVSFPVGPDVEITPAHVTSGDDYFIPDPLGTGWIKSSPLKHKEYVNETSAKVAQTKKFVRLLKEWKYQQEVPISSLYLEMRASKHVRDHPPFVLSMDLAWFFRDLAKSELAPMNDPSRFDGRRIQPVLRPARLEFTKKSVNLAHRASALAEQLRKDDCESEAVKAWEILFDP